MDWRGGIPKDRRALLRWIIASVMQVDQEERRRRAELSRRGVSEDLFANTLASRPTCRQPRKKRCAVYLRRTFREDDGHWVFADLIVESDRLYYYRKDS